jgi:hypothetical protein
VLKKLSVVAVAVAMTSMLAPNAEAGGLKLPGMSEKSAPAAGGDAVAMQAGVIKKYLTAKGNVDSALVKFAEAYGMKDKAAQLDASAKALAGGATSEKDLKENARLSAEAQKDIETKITEGAALSDEGKKLFAAGIPPYAQGVRDTTTLPTEAQAFSDSAKSQIASASMLEKAKVSSSLKPGLWLVQELPGFTGKLTSGLKQIVGFAQKQSIPVPKDALSML